MEHQHLDFCHYLLFEIHVLAILVVAGGASLQVMWLFRTVFCLRFCSASARGAKKDGPN